MGINTSCCFTGHRIIPKNVILPLVGLLDKTVRELYDGGIRDFYCGGALGFDTLAAESVLRIKKEKNDVRLILILPCENQAEKWNSEDIKKYEDIKNHADGVLCLYKTYTQGCMHARNRALVDGASICVAYLTKKSGGSYYTAKYAFDNGKKVINLAKELRELI